MGRAQKLKEERRVERDRQQARAMLRRHRTKLLIALGAFAVVAAVVLPSVIPDKAKQAINTNQTKETPMETQHVTLETSRGTVKLDLYPDKAPKTVTQITTLIKQGFYNGLVFHRVVPGFVVQGGDPTGTGSSGSDLPNLPFERNDLKHEKGALAMARSQSKDSANSQFYITLAPQPSLDGEYVVFGKVVAGMEVVEQIQQGDKMTVVTLAQ